MLDVSDAFTAEERDEVRNVTQGLLVSWKKDTTPLTVRTFTIGVSTIGSSDLIGVNPGSIGGPGNYKYFDETNNVLSLAWEQGLNMPTGGLAKGMAEGVLENTDGRFLPDYMGGNSELFTAILPRRPFIINAGFELDGVPQNIPQFSGVFTRQPEVESREKRLRFVGSDYIDFFYNRYLDQEVMFTSQRTDQVMETLLQDSLGLSTSQYELDTGINIIPFGLFERGTRFSHILNQLAEAENGHFYQDEEGKFRFENRQHWDSGVHTAVSQIIFTADVLDAKAPDDDHIINVVEIKGQPRAKQATQLVFKLSVPIPITAGENKEVFVNFDDPMVQIFDPNVIGNTQEDESGSEISITLKSQDKFATAVKYIFLSSTTGFITQLEVYGRPAKVISDIYFREKDDSSVTAFEERSLLLENDYIQDASWAQSYAGMILQDYAEPEKIQNITIRAHPSLQLGDLISWQGRYWRIFDKKLRLSPSEGFIEDLTLLQRQITSYFRIGISTIGGTDKIAP